MTNTEILNEFFIWEENNSTEPKMKSENKTESELNDSMTNTKIVNEQENWRTITDPKLRKKMYLKIYYESNKNKRKLQDRTYYEANKDKIRAYKKSWKRVNRDKVLLKKKIWYHANKHKFKNYYVDNKDKISLRNNEKYKNNIQYKLRVLLRSRLRGVIKKNYKNGSAVRDLGCTIDELKTHLESKFQPGMSWDNLSKHGWHIDHIKPLASFDLTDRKQFLEAFHYSNLQPLWAKDNLSKGDKLNWCINQDRSPHE